MNVCYKCSAKIPSGRHYCHQHYQEALARYRTELADYENQLAQWQALSPEQRQFADHAAERTQLTLLAALAGALVGGSLWFVIHAVRSIDPLFGIGIVVLCALLFSMVPPLRILFGRLTRWVFIAGIAGGLLVWGTDMMSSISPLVAENLLEFKIGGVALGCAIALFVELSGKTHASGAPSKPSVPQP